LFSLDAAAGGTSYLSTDFGLSQIGVFLFFVISGFLITTLLLNECDRTGSIELGCFYIRRAYRIFPAFYFYITVTVALSWAGYVTLGWSDILRAVTYTINFPPQPVMVVGHIWSLATEEQFYLAWPPVMALFGRKGAMAAAVTAIVFPLLRVALFHLGVPAISLPNGLGVIAAGCLLALVRPTIHGWTIYRWMLRAPVVPLAVVIAYLASGSFPRVHFVNSVLIGPALAVIIDACVTHGSRVALKPLNWAPLKWVGVLKLLPLLVATTFHECASTTAVGWLPA
jgi:peptidoglycan/LPS O-acetylase OafA/YrhL